ISFKLMVEPASAFALKVGLITAGPRSTTSRIRFISSTPDVGSFSCEELLLPSSCRKIRSAAEPQRNTPSPPSSGGEGRGEEVPLSSILSPLLRRGERK